MDSPDLAFDVLDSLEAEHPPTVGIVHAGETEALLPPTLADCRLVWGVELLDTEIGFPADGHLVEGDDFLDDRWLGWQM